MKAVFSIFAAAIYASTAHAASLPVASGYICPSKIPDIGGEFVDLSDAEIDAVFMGWGHGLVSGTDGSLTPITDDILALCASHPSQIAAEQNTRKDVFGFVNYKTPRGGTADGKWYPKGAVGPSMDPGDVPMGKADAEALGITIAD